MYIEEVKKKDGTIAYRFVERFLDPYTNCMKRISITSDKNTASIRKEMPHLLEEKFQRKVKHPPKADTLSFAEISKKWLEVTQTKKKASTYRTAKTRVDKLNRDLGDYAISSLTPIILNELMLNYLKINAHSTVHLVLKTLRQILNFAHEYGYSTIDIADKIKLEKPAITGSDWKFLEKDELRHLLENTDNADYRRAFELMALNGWRIGELIALDYTKHIDLEKQYVDIERTYDYVSKIFTLPKNNRVRRNYINARSIELIQEQIEVDKLRKLHYGLPDENNLLFKTIFGNPQSISGMNKYLKRFNTPDKNITCHIFRHSFITYMIEQGTPFHLIAKHVGHQDTQMIERVYKHFSKGMEKELQKHISTITLF